MKKIKSIFYTLLLIIISHITLFANFESPAFITNQSTKSIKIQQTLGDISAIAIHLTALSLILKNQDMQGFKEYFFSTATTFASTYTLKFSVKRERPDNSNNHSFPSSHTSLRFSGATFIQKRYGYKYGIPSYIAATFVGYSRIAAKKHYTSDVIVGAALGILISELFTSKYKNLNITPNYTKNNFYVTFNYKL